MTSIDSRAKRLARLCEQSGLVGALALGACSVEGPQPIVPIAGSVKAAVARPLHPGMLSVSPDGAYALASDDVGQAVYLIALGAETLERRVVELAPGDEPGRAALTATHAYVTVPRNGALAVVDVVAGGVVDRWNPCPSPQGIVADGSSLHVACRGGELVTLRMADGHVERTLALDADLGDVLVIPSGLVVSRFSSAELLWLDAEGTVTDRTVPKVSVGAQAGVAWRMVLGLSGEVLVGHQMDSEEELGGGYSGGVCGSITMPTVTTFVPPGVTLAGVPGFTASEKPQQIRQFGVAGAAGTFDLAAYGEELALVFPGNVFAERYRVAQLAEVAMPTEGESLSGPIRMFLRDTDGGTCAPPAGTQEEPAVPVAVATPGAGPLAGRPLVLTHSPATVRALNIGGLSVALHQEDRENTGLELFQMTVGSGIACASCHPGGRSDARTWRLARGPRRTQPLEGGVSHLGAFHWDAEFASFDALTDDVMTARMGLDSELRPARKTALLSFLDSIPRAPLPSPSHDADAALRGRALFESEATECVNCHGGPLFTSNQPFDVGTGGKFVTPSLIGVGYREPLMHDGCASDLHDRFGPCGGGDAHGKTSHLSDADVSDLVAYMKTL